MSFFSKNKAAFGSEELLAQQEEAEADAQGNEQPVVDDQFMAEAEAMEAHEQAMSEVSERMEKAKTYDLVRQNPFIEQNSQQAYEVQTEIQKFVELRLQLLMGMAPDANLLKYVLDLLTPGRTTTAGGSSFDGEQTKALQLWADKLLKRPSLFEASKPQPASQPGPRLAPIAAKAEPTMNVVKTQARTRPAAKSPSQRKQPVITHNPQPIAEQADDDLTPPTPRRTMDVQDNRTGKTVKVSLDTQAKPKGIQPMPFPNSANGIDNTQGGAAGGALASSGVKSRLISHFLNNG